MGLEQFTKPPVDPTVAQTQNTGAEGTPNATETTPSTETSTQSTQTAQAQSTETKPDEFFENFNKRFSSSFKTDDEVKNLLGMPQKIGELEGKIKLTEDYASKIEDYEKQIENFKNNDSSALFEKPLIRQAFVAQQLLEKYPDKDPETLRQIVMSDVSKMSDLDVLVKNQKINLPNFTESDIKSALLDKYGIDPETKPEEWSSIAKVKMGIDAQEARTNIKTLTNGIELPKAATQEERDRIANENLQKRITESEPLKKEFLQFDKFKIGDFEYDTPADFKSKLPDMFDAFFIQAGQEATKENLQAAVELRDAMFLHQNFEKIKEVISKGAQTEIQKKLDEALNNTKPPNTATATDVGAPTDQRRGLGAFLEDMRI